MRKIAQDLNQLLDRLDPETALLLEQTVRDAVALASQRVTPANQKDDRGYPVGYFEATAGCFSNEPLERPSHLPFEKRDSW